MSVVVELVWWSSTDEFLADYDVLFKPTVDHVSTAPGCLKAYYGIESENKTNFWMVVVWKSHQHHQAMMDRPDYPAMVERLKPFFRDGQLHMRHVRFNNHRLTAFDAPVTGLLFLAAKQQDVEEDVVEVLETWSRVIDFDKNAYPPSTWGMAEEDAKELIFVIGRKAAEGLVDSKEESPSAYLEAISELGKVADIRVLHVQFKQADHSSGSLSAK